MTEAEPHQYPCTLQPPVGYSYIRLTQAQQLSVQKRERANRFYSFQVQDDLMEYPCSLIEIIPRNLESVLKDFFERDILYIDSKFTRRAQREYLFVPHFANIPACQMSVWDFVAQYFDFNVIIDADLQQVLSQFLQDNVERQQFSQYSNDKLSQDRLRVVDFFRMFKSPKISLAQFDQLPRLHSRIFAVASFNKCELLIQDIQEIRQDPVTAVASMISGVTSGCLREVSSAVGNALKPYLDRQGLFAARFCESPINKLIDYKGEITCICIGAGYSAFRPLLQYRIATSQCGQINLFISLRNREDLGFLRSMLEDVQKPWFNLYFVCSDNDIEFGKLQFMTAIKQENQCFKEGVQLCYCGKHQAMLDLKECIMEAFSSNNVNGEKEWNEMVSYSWINH